MTNEPDNDGDRAPPVTDADRRNFLRGAAFAAPVAIAILIALTYWAGIKALLIYAAVIATVGIACSLWAEWCRLR